MSPENYNVSNELRCFKVVLVALLALTHLSISDGQMAMLKNASRLENVYRTPMWYLSSGATFHLPGRTIMNWHVHGTLAMDPNDSCLAIGRFHVSGHIYYVELVLAIPAGPNHALSARCSASDPYFAVTRVGYYTYIRLLPRELYGRNIYKTPLPRSCLSQNGTMFYLEVMLKALQPADCHARFFKHISPWTLVSGPIE